MISSFGQIYNITPYQIINGRALLLLVYVCGQLWMVHVQITRGFVRADTIEFLRQICIPPLVCLKCYRILEDFCPHSVFQKCSKILDSSTLRIYVNYRIHVLENLETTFKHSFSFNCYIYRLSEVDLTCDSDGEQLRWSFKCGMFQNCC